MYVFMYTYVVVLCFRDDFIDTCLIHPGVVLHGNRSFGRVWYFIVLLLLFSSLLAAGTAVIVSKISVRPSFDVLWMMVKNILAGSS